MHHSRRFQPFRQIIIPKFQQLLFSNATFCNKSFDLTKLEGVSFLENKLIQLKNCDSDNKILNKINLINHNVHLLREQVTNNHNSIVSDISLIKNNLHHKHNTTEIPEASKNLIAHLNPSNYRDTDDQQCIRTGRFIAGATISVLLAWLASSWFLYYKQESEFITAVHQQDVATVKRLKNKGVSPDRNQVIDLMYHAAVNDNVEIITLLGDKYRMASALNIALTRKNFKAAESLIKSGSAFTNFYENRCDPWYRAILDSDYESIVFLIEHGFDVTYDRDYGLLNAAANGSYRIVELLISAGASSYNFNSAMLSAADHGHSNIVKLLIRYGAQINVNDFQAIKRAAILGHRTVVDALIESGAPFRVSKIVGKVIVIERLPLKK